MSWFDPARITRQVARFAAVAALAALTAGCFQPLYGDRTVAGGTPLVGKLAGVEVARIDAPQGSRLARVGSEVLKRLLSRPQVPDLIIEDGYQGHEDGSPPST